MKKHIDELDRYDAIITLIEVLEIKTNNKLVADLQHTASKELAEYFSKKELNPHWLIQLILKAREEARKEIPNN